jgi:hypothetical protein
MSEPDQEIISSLRRVYEAFSRADFDTAIAMAHPEMRRSTGRSATRVAAAARQLKPLASQGLPLVAILANPSGAPVDLEVRHVLAALYGNPRWVVTIDPQIGGSVGEPRFELGRDGKLTTDHPYLGGVGLLRRRERALDASRTIIAADKRLHGEPVTAEERRERDETEGRRFESCRARFTVLQGLHPMGIGG